MKTFPMLLLFGFGMYVGYGISYPRISKCLGPKTILCRISSHFEPEGGRAQKGTTLEGSRRPYEPNEATNMGPYTITRFDLNMLYGP